MLRPALMAPECAPQTDGSVDMKCRLLAMRGLKPGAAGPVTDQLKQR